MNGRTTTSDSDTRKGLEAAEARGNAMFDAIERAGLVRPGISEKELDDQIYILAKRDFGVNIHWHKRVVRTGVNTVCIYSDDPPNRIIAPDDTIYLDLGPVFASDNLQWEADLGRSYALGNDTNKKRLVTDLPRLFDLGKAHFEASPNITGAELYAFTCAAARDAGWEYGGPSAGHIVGEFPHSKLVPGDDRNVHRIAPRNTRRMRDPDDAGHARFWILEIHLVDKARTFGGFYERLL
jgi:Xaa-Pro dipeptidase